ncbi:NADH-quinone oxidoreductase subunit I [Natronoglycomyces albus]|uniref:NADH-quinone oxidoreductase subunit I n=2 Tax=Natronoglycomyces albus TaxID=2811108 RepID=A0A895XJ04_9ACTN|nr:NADH-quinone oxidoreductase subunit I [Natronoglycomyces albus]QSB04947.1 NADH-quinone oxidoreductase subunit I [Natronoglycomyces albus]
MSFPGSGLLKGLATTAKTATRRAVTEQYPENKPDLPDRTRGVIALSIDNCTSCMLCARECPDWCIYIDSHKETVQEEGAARPRQVNVLDQFDIDFSLCMYCGICIDVCPFDALFWSPEFEYAEGDIRNLLHNKEGLNKWMDTVPEANLPAPKEDKAAPKRAAKKAANKPVAKTLEPEATDPAAKNTRPNQKTTEPSDASGQTDTPSAEDDQS